MKKLLLAFLFLTLTPALVSAQTVLTVPRGGTGLPYPTTGWKAGNIIFGNGTGALATSSAFIFSNSGSLLTVTNASSTSLSAQSFCLTNDVCRSTWPSGGVSFAWPFTKQADNAQATSTLLELFGGIFTNASSTLASTTVSTLLASNSTTTNLYVGGTLTAANLYDSGLVGSACVGETGGLLTTSNCVSSITGTSNQVTASPTTGSVILTIPSTFHIANASTTVLDVGNAFFGQTATSSFNGAGALFVVGSSTLQNFSGQNATTTNFNLTQPALSFGSSGGVYVGSTTQRTMNFASSTLDANGFSPNMGNATTTLPFGVNREGTKILGIGCQASTTNGVAGGFLIKLGTLPSTFTETVFCDTNYREINLSTNVQVAGHIPVYAFVSKASTTPQTGFVTEIFQKVSTGAN